MRAKAYFTVGMILSMAAPVVLTADPALSVTHRPELQFLPYQKLTEGAGPQPDNGQDPGTASGGAGDVQAKADDAQTKTGEAQVKAENVQAKADDAQTKAGEAQVKAENVQAKAESVQAKADDAQTKAGEAQVKAENVQAKTDDAQTKTGEAQAKTVDLSPVKLASPMPTDNLAPAKAEGDTPVLNATVSVSGFVPKAPIDRTDTILGSNNDQGKKDKNAVFDKKVHDMGMKLGPVPLQESAAESDKKIETIVDAEKSELADLWDAALCRNQDIQFVVQKLMPSKDPRHTTAVMMKMLSTAMYGAMAASGFLMPSGVNGANAMGMYSAQNAGAGLIMSVLNSSQSKAAKKAQVSETEAISLYSMIRGVADRLADSYHSYKKYLTSLTRAGDDYTDLQSMAADANKSSDSGTQMHIEYLLRKSRRDIQDINEDARRCRQALVDMCGPDAVVQLDKQIATETDKIQTATPIDIKTDTSTTASRPQASQEEESKTKTAAVETAGSQTQ